MKNLWIVLLVVLVGAGAFLLGRRSGESPVPAGAPAGGAPAPASPPSVVTTEPVDKPSDAPSEPVRTYRGPDGRAHIINYDQNNPPNSDDPEQVRKALLSDMKFYPRNIELNYNLANSDIQAMLAGTKSIPDYMLPPQAPKAR